jgi:hypothetical protein
VGTSEVVIRHDENVAGALVVSFATIMGHELTKWRSAANKIIRSKQHSLMVHKAFGVTV